MSLTHAITKFCPYKIDCFWFQDIAIFDRLYNQADNIQTTEQHVTQFSLDGMSNRKYILPIVSLIILYYCVLE